MTAILSYRLKHECHTLLPKSTTERLKMSNSLPHFLLKTAILNFYLHPVLADLCVKRQQLITLITIDYADDGWFLLMVFLSQQ